MEFISELLIFATKPEAGEWEKRGIPFFQVGIGPTAVARKEKELVQILGKGITRVLHIGLAGALDQALRAGDISLPQSITDGKTTLKPDAFLFSQLEKAINAARLTVFKGPLFSSETVLETAVQKKEAGEKWGAQTVDMESFWVAQICAREKIPYVALRGVFDALDKDLSALAEANLMTPEGNLNPAGLIGLPLKPKLLFQLPQFQSVMNRTNKKLFRIYKEFSSCYLPATHEKQS